MVQTLEAIKGGGGSIKVGTTGTISALMSRELKSVKSASSAAVPNAAAAATTTIKKLKQRESTDEASSSGSSTNVNEKNLEVPRKNKHHTRKTHKIPILDSHNVSIDGTPIRVKPEKKGSYIVEVVDIKCGSPDRAWAAPITNRLKKLGFSKLSETMPN